jgi:acyl phosphate:glycerol-3-phosphate acyltransferase
MGPLATIPPDFAVVAVLVAYLAGSIPFGVIVARARGVDLTRVGSGNIGATNVARTLGKRLGALVLLGDALKGTLPVLAAAAIFGRSDWRAWITAAVAAAAFLGHLYPLYLGFKGGKGVATGLGVFIALAPLPTLIAAGVFGLVYGVTRLSSLGSLVATTVMPFAMWALGAEAPTLALAVVLWAFIMYKHRGNIQRLLRRQESKV